MDKREKEILHEVLGFFFNKEKPNAPQEEKKRHSPNMPMRHIPKPNKTPAPQPQHANPNKIPIRWNRFESEGPACAQYKTRKPRKTRRGGCRHKRRKLEMQSDSGGETQIAPLPEGAIGVSLSESDSD